MSAFTADAGLVFGDVCVICQEDVTDRGRLDGCAHLFCVPCIVRWAEVETKCPLCKARFEVIYPDAYGTGEKDCDDGEDGDGDAPERTRVPRAGLGRSRLRRRPIRVVRRDQTYEDPDGDPLNGLDLDDVTCGTCGEGGDEDKLMLCDGCDAGHHCFCVGLDAVPLEEWRCRLCAETEAPSVGVADGDANVGSDRDVRVSVSQTPSRHVSDTLEAPSTRTVATVRARVTLAGLAEDERRVARAEARRRAAGLRAARAATPESRARAATRDVGLDGIVRESFDARGASVSFPRRAAFPRSGGADTDARRRQVERVRELRRMWDRYRNGEIAFDGAGAGTLGAATTTNTERTDRDACFRDRPTGSRAPSAPNAPTASPAPPSLSSPERSDAERRRLAAAATLAAVGWSGGGGEACLANAPGRVFSGGADDGSRRESAAGRDGRDGESSQQRLLKRARRREPAARRASDVFATSLGATSLGGASLSFRMTHTRSLPAALAGGASRGGASRGGGSGPDRKGAFAGVAFSPPRSGAAGDLSRFLTTSKGAGVSVPEPSGWTSSDEDEASGRPRAAAANDFKNPSPPKKEGNTTKVFLASRATGFVPPGSVTHVPPATSARDAEAARRAMLRDAEAAGAPDKARVVQMVKARLKPYYRAHGSAGERGSAEGDAATENAMENRKRIVTAAQFKDLAKRASAAARAAAAAAALKHGPDESADGAREEAIARAVRRAVDAALARAGIEVMKRLHPRE